MQRSTQMRPLPSMNAVSTRIVITANSELTIPRPMSLEHARRVADPAGELLGLLLELAR